MTTCRRLDVSHTSPATLDAAATRTTGTGFRGWTVRGQRQRVAVGRAIVRKPKVFLFDEPLSNLDAKLRVQMRAEISKLHTSLAATMIYVTHDQTEAMTMGDRIVVMKEGRIQQIDQPLNLYANPVNQFVAGFIGSPAMNIVEGVLKGGVAALPNGSEIKTTCKRDGSVSIGIRPEHVAVSTENGEIPATVKIAEHLGAETYLHVEADGYGPMTVRATGEVPLGEHDKIFLTPEQDRIHRFDAHGLALGNS